MSERLNLWALRVLALVIALALWFLLSFEPRLRQSERVLEAAVSFDTANNFLILDPLQTLSVRVRGKKARIQTLNPLLVSAVVELKQAETGPVEVLLGPENVFAPEGVEVVSVDPKSIQLVLDREISLSLPIEATLVGEPAAGARADRPIVTPATTTVHGPESKLENIRVVLTKPISLDGHLRSITETVSIESPDPLARVEPSVVRVRVPIEPPQLSDRALGNGSDNDSTSSNSDNGDGS